MVIFNEAGNLQCLSHLELTVWIWLLISAPVVRLVWQFLLRLWDYKTVLFIDYAAICLFIHQPCASIPLSGYSFFVKNTNLASAYCIFHGLHEAGTLLLCPLFNLIEWIWPLIALSLASSTWYNQRFRNIKTWWCRETLPRTCSSSACVLISVLEVG